LNHADGEEKLRIGQQIELAQALSECPWFKDAPIAKLKNVALPQPHHLFWPDLDVEGERHGCRR